MCNLDIKHASGTVVSVSVSASASSKATIATNPITSTSTLAAESPKFKPVAAFSPPSAKAIRRMWKEWDSVPEWPYPESIE